MLGFPGSMLGFPGSMLGFPGNSSASACGASPRDPPLAPLSSSAAVPGNPDASASPNRRWVRSRMTVALPRGGRVPWIDAGVPRHRGSAAPPPSPLSAAAQRCAPIAGRSLARGSLNLVGVGVDVDVVVAGVGVGVGVVGVDVDVVVGVDVNVDKLPLPQAQLLFLLALHLKQAPNLRLRRRPRPPDGLRVPRLRR
eukprot:1538249-Pyramimonas_sp.AAC.1